MSFRNPISFHFLQSKIYFKILNWLLYFFTPVAVLAVTFVISRSLPLGIVMAIGIIGASVLFICIARPKIAFYLNLIFVFSVYLAQRILKADFSVSAGTEVLIVTMLVSIMIKKIVTHERMWQHINNPITYTNLVLLIFILIEAFNPNIDNLSGWKVVFRKAVEVFVYYLVSLYILDSKKEIIKFIKWWLVLVFLAALYACYEQWFGLFHWDYAWAASNPLIWRIYFQGGFLRKFSTLSDPPAFGILAAATAVLAICMTIGQKFSIKKKGLLVIAAIVMLLGMSYSGTRTATILVPMGIAFYIMLTIRNKKTIILLGCSILAAILILAAPVYNNPVLNRVRTAFHPAEDASLDVRKMNRQRMQPYMHHHPIGGGVETTGLPGLENYPNHPLAGFPPDGGFTQSALEIGWIGLGLSLLVYFVVLKFGISRFYESKDPQIKNVYAAVTAALFCLIISKFSQVGPSSFSIVYIYTPAFVILIKLKYFEHEPSLNF